tara:strand:+ start:210 stop:488 length:279 start_codon:yes stop_codon:yes gene_type:complete
MTVKEQIRAALCCSNNIHALCDRLRNICDTNNDQCPAKKLLHSIRHLTITKVNILDVNILETSDGTFNLINSNTKKELNKQGIFVHTIPLNF